MQKQFFNLSNDILFKTVFRDFELLKKLMFQIFQVDITGYDYDNPRIQARNKGLSNGEYDLLLSNGKEYLIIEMQNRKYGEFVNRNSVYRSALVMSDWKKGDRTYEKVLPVKIFWLLNYPYHKNEYLKYQMLEKYILKKFGDGNEVHIFNIKYQHRSEILNKYKVLFNAKVKEEIECFIDDEDVGDMVKKVLEYNGETESYSEMERRMLMLWTVEDEMKLQRIGSFQRGMEKGEKQGAKKATKEIASNLLQAGIPIELIAKATKLSEQQIQNYVRS